MNDQNICKFILPREQEPLTASNFIFEQRAAHSGETRTLSDHVLYLTAAGEGLFRCCDACHRLKSGTVFFSFADTPFSVESTDALKYYYITFNGGRAEELFRRFGITPGNAVFEGLEGLLPLWQDSLARANEENIDLLSESLVLYTFSKLKKAEPGRDKVAFVLTYLEKHFTDPGLSLGSVADAAGYNAKYLSHLFKKEFGMGFAEYLRLLRIKHAVMLIENGVTSVKNVALLSGFTDPLYFSRVFTDTMGVSPKNYKK